MSLILEALRKSEAERQIARTPGLMTPATALPQRRRPNALLAAGLVLLMLVGALGWWLGRGTLEPSPTHPPRATLPSAQAPAETVQAVEAAPVVAVAPAPMKPVPPRPPEPARPPAAQRTDAAAPSSDPAPVAAVAPPAPASPSAAAVVAIAPPQPYPDAHEDAFEQERLPGLEALPAARRSQLPPLRISMHVFAGEPAQRFVLIDGRRYAQAQSVEPGVEIDEIRRDGVVLAIDGIRVLLLRP